MTAGRIVTEPGFPRIKELWDDPARAAALGAAAGDYLRERFNQERFYRTLMEIYREVLS